jgi:hypothetical protein
MKKLDETAALLELICTEEQNQTAQLVLVKEQFHAVSESFKPVNIIRNLIDEVAASPEIKTKLVNSAIGLGTGLLTERLVMGNSKNPFKKILGSVLQFAVANVVAKHSDSLKTIGENLLKRLVHSRT